MKILFLGDSITEGIPGVSYFKILKGKLLNDQLINSGKGGDTVISLNQRVKTMQMPSDTDLIALCVGTNDIFVKVSKNYPIIKMVLNQPWARSREEFGYYFRDTLEYLSDKTKRIVVVSPLLIGEDIDNVWNGELDSLIDVIHDSLKEFQNIEYLDIRKTFVTYLQGHGISKYVPRSAIRVVIDAITLKTSQKVDEKSADRGLHLTLDGVHPNGFGAKLIADCLEHYVKTLNE